MVMGPNEMRDLRFLGPCLTLVPHWRGLRMLLGVFHRSSTPNDRRHQSQDPRHDPRHDRWLSKLSLFRRMMVSYRNFHP